MKQSVIRFKSMKIALKEIEPFIRDGTYLENGKQLKELGGMRPREILANWLICTSINAIDKSYDLNFSSDPRGGDGIIRDNVTGQTWFTEHVFVTERSGTNRADTEKLILDAIEKKRTKGGVAYAAGKILIVLLNSDTGKWLPNKVAQKLPNPLLFNEVWVIALQTVKDGAYEYGVTLLDRDHGNAPIYRVHINDDFNSWEVRVAQ